MDEVADQILDVLEEHELTMAEGIALLEMVKYNLLVAGHNLAPEGATLQ